MFGNTEELQQPLHRKDARYPMLWRSDALAFFMLLISLFHCQIFHRTYATGIDAQP